MPHYFITPGEDQGSSGFQPVLALHGANSAAQPSAVRGNRDVPNTAARYVCKAMTKVAPHQRAALLASIIDQAQDALAMIGGAA